MATHLDPPDELYVYRPQGDINSTGNLNDAPYSEIYDHSELNDYSDPSCFCTMVEKVVLEGCSFLM